ncbi:MAG: MBL fold metallo-hydrolase [Desulfuromonadaceae bacterium]|nr:MBL fold metallo-hydrolase [Desulfuromonadaceae bacterium]
MQKGEIKLSILVDNYGDDGLSVEHGFSLWIETAYTRILFDTGQGPALPGNACALECDLSQADILVLSHGHYDHTGGVPHVLNVNPGIQVYCHAGVFLPSYSIATEGGQRISPCLGNRAPPCSPAGLLAAGKGRGHQLAGDRLGPTPDQQLALSPPDLRRSLRTAAGVAVATQPGAAARHFDQSDPGRLHFAGALSAGRTRPVRARLRRPDTAVDRQPLPALGAGRCRLVPLGARLTGRACNTTTQ